MGSKNFRFYLALGLFGINLAFSDDRIRVEVIDTGVDVGNETIKKVLCPSKEHLDAVTGKNRLANDSLGHGSHVAGIITALAGSKGYCLNVCRYYTDESSGAINLRNMIRCIKHAKEVGAEIINYSGGGPKYSADERAAIAAFAPGIMVTAAGNEHSDLDVPGNEYYPASYLRPNTVVVGSTDIKNVRAPTSNWGTPVSLMVIGENIYSALAAGERGYLSGTSMATAIATGSMLRVRLGLPPIGDAKAYRELLKRFWSEH